MTRYALKEGEVVATVTDVVTDRGPPYAVTVTESVPGSVTFSLSPDEGVWIEDENPSKGYSVVLGKIRKFRGMWRAFHARFLRPDDESAEQQGVEHGK